MNVMLDIHLYFLPHLKSPLIHCTQVQNLQDVIQDGVLSTSANILSFTM